MPVSRKQKKTRQYRIKRRNRSKKFGKNIKKFKRMSGGEDGDNVTFLFKRN